MAQSFGSAFRSFWHTMTSHDRHSNYDSPYRTGRHVPLNRQGVFTGVATASDSRADISSPYLDDGHATVMDTAYGGAAPSPVLGPMSPGNRPYSPGMRSLSAQRQSAAADGFEVQSPHGEIPMQSFEGGLPPPPSVHSSWSKMDKWAEEHYPELYDQICEGCTSNDLNELEHQLDCSLPQDVRESLLVHDGQERGGLPTGIIFGSMLLDCEEMVQEWENWRKVNHEFLLDMAVAKPSVPTRALGGTNTPSSSKAGPSSAPTSPQSSHWRQDLMQRQDCVPPGAVQKVYAHPSWIPLVRDWGGNNLAVDLAPGPRGNWGQIILFGRDYDTKYVVARSWASFLAIVADDLNSGRWFVDEDTQELKLREFKAARVEPAYFDILRWRMDQRYGRTAAKRKSAVPRPNSPSASASPYHSPTDANSETRGRTLQRLGNNSPMGSPVRPGFGKPSPLARVTEESAPLSGLPNGADAPEKLVEVDTPRPSGEENVRTTKQSASADASAVADDHPDPKQTGPDAAQQNGEREPVALEEAMKDIEI